MSRWGCKALVSVASGRKRDIESAGQNRQGVAAERAAWRRVTAISAQFALDDALMTMLDTATIETGGVCRRPSPVPQAHRPPTQEERILDALGLLRGPLPRVSDLWLARYFHHLARGASSSLRRPLSGERRHAAALDDGCYGSPASAARRPRERWRRGAVVQGGPRGHDHRRSPTDRLGTPAGACQRRAYRGLLVLVLELAIRSGDLELRQTEHRGGASAPVPMSAARQSATGYYWLASTCVASPPARVASAANTAKLMLWLISRTDPSPKATFAPPGWKAKTSPEPSDP